MAYDITSLDSRLKNYLSASKDQLISDAVFNSHSSRLFTLQTGVNNPTAIIALDSTITLADGSNCGFTAAGSDTFSNRILTPAPIAVNKSFCPKTLLNSWKASDVRMSATKQDAVPFEEEIIANNINVLGAEIEKLLWQGDKTNGQGNMALQDGIYTLISDDITNSVIPAGNVIAKGTDTIATRVQKVWLALPANIADKCTIVMSIANYKSFIVELANSNNYHIFEQYDGEYRMRLPYANIDVMGIEGLEGLDVVIAMPLNENYYGVDLEGDAEDVDFYFDKSDRNFKMVIEFSVAVNYLFPDHIYVNQ